MTGLRKLLVLGTAVVVALPIVLGIAGYYLFTRADMDQLRPADAIVVLGGEHDGREAYGLQLAREGIAKTVVLSDPYGPQDTLMDEACAAGTTAIRVICFAPDPSTTRGEAMFTQRLAEQYGWKTVVVISWRYHLLRARFIFDQCFDGDVIMRGVPRTYNFSLMEWEGVYAYQVVGMVKAVVVGC
jgi:uncharacterized SAM-binding protein YcdF (DUF218 family)